MGCVFWWVRLRYGWLGMALWGGLAGAGRRSWRLHSLGLVQRNQPTSLSRVVLSENRRRGYEGKERDRWLEVHFTSEGSLGRFEEGTTLDRSAVWRLLWHQHREPMRATGLAADGQDYPLCHGKKMFITSPCYFLNLILVKSIFVYMF